jgi:hypothetical protein
MIAIIVDNHCHRLLNSGVVESAKMFHGTDESFDDEVICDNWDVLNPELDLQIPAGDFDAFIKKHLEVLHAVFPADRKPLPTSEKVETVIAPANEVKI